MLANVHQLAHSLAARKKHSGPDLCVCARPSSNNTAGRSGITAVVTVLTTVATVLTTCITAFLTFLIPRFTFFLSLLHHPKPNGSYLVGYPFPSHRCVPWCGRWRRDYSRGSVTKTDRRRRKCFLHIFNSGRQGQDHPFRYCPSFWEMTWRLLHPFVQEARSNCLETKDSSRCPARFFT